MTITFHLNGDEVSLPDVEPTTTLLDWLRESRGLTGTKEGCNEGDCGACTVMVSDGAGTRALNACILFLPQLQGKSVRTVEGASAPDGTLHPVQQAMIDHHGSQCGFCTPGFVMSMVVAHTKGARDHDTQLAGNLCRCTGYAPIIRAADAAAALPVPDWIAQDVEAAADTTTGTTSDIPADSSAALVLRPTGSDALAKAYAARPDATLIAGATDVGLWVTKQMRDLGDVIFLDGCQDLREIAPLGDNALRIGAMVSIERVREALMPYYPSFAEMLRRFASAQVRAAATLGGNIANGSPIGDSPPVLIALGAELHLRQGDRRRILPIEDFFVAYGKQDRAPGEFLEAISLPLPTPQTPGTGTGADTAHPLRVYKVSKRFDQDISAVLGAFDIRIKEGIVRSARLAYGGMAGIPARARAAEAALTGAPWNAHTRAAARAALAQDFTPMSDMRASAQYRLDVAGQLLERYAEDIDAPHAPLSVLEVQP